MSTFITTKSFHEVRKDGKVVNKKMLDARYDGNNAVIDTFENDKAYRFELSKQDIQNMLQKLISKKGYNLNTDFLGNNSTIKEYLISKENNSTRSAKDKTEKRGKKGRKQKKPNRQRTRGKPKRARRN